MSYGTNGPFGLQPRQSMTAATYNGALNEYQISPPYPTALFTGDPISWGNNGTLIRWAAGQQCAGTFRGCKYFSAVPGNQGNVVFSPFWPGNQNIAPNTQVTALILDDKTTLYDAQASISGNVAAATSQLGVTQNNLGLNANVSLGGTFTDAGVLGIPSNPASGSTLSGQSGFYLDTSTISASQNLLLKILRLTPNPRNVIYTAPANQGIGNGHQGAFNNVICQLNNTTSGTGTPGGNLVVATGVLTAANMQGMNAAPVQILAAPGAGLAIIVNSFVLSVINLHNNTAYANGGIIGLQYGVTAALAGTRVTTTEPATILTIQGSLGPFTFNAVPVTPVQGDTAAGSISISNATAAFITGTPDYQYTITYSVVPFPY